MRVGGEAEFLPEALEDAAKQVGRVEASQGHEQLKLRYFNSTFLACVDVWLNYPIVG